MATMLIRLKIRSGMEARYEALQKDLYEKTHRLEKNVLRYEMWRGEAPRSYYCLLAYPDFNTFMFEHQISGYHEEATPPLLDVIEEETIEWVDPVQGASSLPPTREQGLPPNAPEIARTYAEVFNLTCPSWWAALR
jgi:hypothetical protein